ncbi:hypothetical protein BkAM31D_12640 [Halalkalibacter krulwichiae]|uniref:Uncharacterized protein n=1 Tax=Halalkalibacter krulwichiae TaxID=199441 RepID=A0A1X9MB21_9BACI|nr:hypothetical protein BkAM31D_12640 [Halalkalibacter krulwichiae]
MNKKSSICPYCQSEMKQLKHSIICKCGFKFKTIKAALFAS